MLPKFRTFEYSVWLACERFGILPPGCKSSWEDMNVWAQSQLLAFDQIRWKESEASSNT